MKICRKGPLTSGLWMIVLKFANPTPVFQPGSSSSLPEVKAPRPLSWNTRPSLIRMNASRFAA